MQFMGGKNADEKKKELSLRGVVLYDLICWHCCYSRRRIREGISPSIKI
jgi:hypothetical protein